jgi:PAS domain S-box-containing protein
MRFNINEIAFLIATILTVIGLIIIIYSRNNRDRTSYLFILMLILSILYLVSHSIHFIFMRTEIVTALDLSCHSLLLLMIVTLTFFTWNYPNPRTMGIARTLAIIIPSIIILILLWDNKLITASHIHLKIHRYEAHYAGLYPLYLIWYLVLIIINIYWLLRKYYSSKEQQIKNQLLLFLVGIIITNILLYTFGFLLPWIVGFYFLIEISPLAFLFGVVLFTSVAVGKYNMFPFALKRVRTFGINKKILLSALILVPIIILFIEIPIIRILFKINSSDEILRFFLLSIIGGIIVSVSMAFVIIKIISNPLAKLKANAVEIEKGNYGTVVDISSNDEIGLLAEAFNNMSTTLLNNAGELKNREARISLLLNAFEKSTAAIAIVDNDFIIIEANDAFCKLIGLDKKELLLKTIKDVQFEKSLSQVFETIKSKLSDSNYYEGEIQIEKGKGNKTLLLSISHNTSFDKVPAGYLFVEVDITDRKKLEEQLLNTKKLAALGEMAAVLAHEIKNPLTSIKMNTDILEESLQLKKEDEFPFVIIKKEINRLNNLVKDVLLFSRQMELQYSDFDIKDLITELKFQLQGKIEKKNISLISKTDCIKISADYEKLKQVFLNLIENSIEAVDNNGYIEIRTDINNGELQITIKDNGAGIKNGEKIFEPFFTSKASGTGLGLSISQKIIEQHSGSLSLISSEPGNTIFRIILPYKN